LTQDSGRIRRRRGGHSGQGAGAFQVAAGL